MVKATNQYIIALILYNLIYHVHHRSLRRPGSNRVTWSEFQSACHKLRYTGDVAGAWRAFDADLSGYLTLNEVDTEASDAGKNRKTIYKKTRKKDMGNYRKTIGKP